ncbi:pterin-4-alpha-carbinolamine dehydratase [Mycolicibacterium brisbanense]|nr:pterin-4-alpha-carbinolamine dehydratase [Mycolicibacterium brisbanense]
MADPRADANLDTEFLVQLPGQRDAVVLPRCDLAAGQFPQAGQLRGPVTLGNQQRTLRDQCPCHDDLLIHRARRYTVEGMAVLTNDQVDAALVDLPNWERAAGALRRSVKFPAFLDGIDAVRRVAEFAEQKDHHPDIDIRWRTVTFALVTHSAGGITEKDVEMAGEIDRILGL